MGGVVAILSLRSGVMLLISTATEWFYYSSEFSAVGVML